MNSGSPSRILHHPFRGMDLAVVNSAQHCQVRQFRLTAVLPRDQVVNFAPRGRAPTAGVRATAVPGGHRPTQPVRDGPGGPADVEGLALAVQHDRHHRGVAAQHPQRLRRDRAAEVQTPGAGPVLQILQPDQHVHVRAVPTARRAAPRTGRGRAHTRTRRPAPRPAAPRRCGRPRRSAAWHGRRSPRRSRRTSPRRRTGPSPSPRRPAAGSGTARSPGPGAGRRAAHRPDPAARPAPCPTAAARAGCTGRPCRPAAPPHPPNLRREPPGRPARQHPGDHLDVPQTRPPRREHLRRRRQPGRQHGSVQPRARRHLLGSRHPAAGLEPLPAQQIAQRLNRRPVAPLGEHPVAVQPGNRGHGDLIQLPRRRLTQRQNRHPLTRRARLRHPTQRIHRLHKQALRGSERALGHAYIFASTTDNFGASATIPSKISREVRATTSLASCRTRQTNNARFHPPDTPAAEPPRLASVTRAPPRRPRRTRRSGRRRAGSRAGSRSPRPVRGCGRRGSR